MDPAASRPATLITGASSGLGADFARLCAKRGEELVLVARRRDRLESLRAELGGRPTILVKDLSDRDAAAEIMADVERAGLHVETLINNAGFGLIGQFASLPADRELEMIEVNVAALTELTRLALPGMIARRGGGILNVASTAAFQAGPGMAVYFATKAFVLSLTEAIHREVKGTGVRVSALCPGPTKTEFGEVAGGTGNAAAVIRYADSTEVVRAGLDGLRRNKAVVIPGFANKFTAQSNRILPRATMRWIVSRLKL